MLRPDVKYTNTILPSTTSGSTTGNTFDFPSGRASFQASETGTGAITATVVIEVSNDNLQFLTMGTITLSGTNSTTDGFVSDAPWNYVRARMTSISGTGAAVVVTMGA